MNLQEAKQKAINMLDYLKPCSKRIEVVGSIRREKEDCRDIDIILIPNEKFTMDFVNSLNPIKKGDKLIMFELQNIQYDLYICTEENWEVIKLIRTGSKEHNKKLCFLAIKKGLSLKAGGEGLVDKKGIVISNTEEGILMELLNKYIEPKNRR